MNIVPGRKARSLGRRLVAIRTDIGKLSEDIRGLVDDVADAAMMGADQVVRPVAKTLTVVTARMNGKRRSRAFNLGAFRARPIAVAAATFGTVALIGGFIARRGAFNGRSFLSA